MRTSWSANYAWAGIGAPPTSPSGPTALTYLVQCGARHEPEQCHQSGALLRLAPGQPHALQAAGSSGHTALPSPTCPPLWSLSTTAAAHNSWSPRNGPHLLQRDGDIRTIPIYHRTAPMVPLHRCKQASMFAAAAGELRDTAVSAAAAAVISAARIMGLPHPVRSLPESGTRVQQVAVPDHACAPAAEEARCPGLLQAEEVGQATGGEHSDMQPGPEGALLPG